MSLYPQGRVAVFAITLCYVASANTAYADCSIIDQLRTAAKMQFRAISGEKISRLGDDLKSTLKVDGAKCKITRAEDGKSASHSCEWLISKDLAETRDLFRAMITETAPCLRSRRPPSTHSHDRSGDATFDDVPNTYVTIHYDFDSGWYLLDLEYGIETK